MPEVKYVEALVRVAEAPWLVWSNEHNAWWGADERGYFTDVRAAGRYTREQALEIEANARRPGSGGMFSHDGHVDPVPPEIAVPSPEYHDALATLKTVEVPTVDSAAQKAGTDPEQTKRLFDLLGLEVGE